MPIRPGLNWDVNRMSWIRLILATKNHHWYFRVRSPRAGGKRIVMEHSVRPNE